MPLMPDISSPNVVHQGGVGVLSMALDACCPVIAIARRVLCPPLIVCSLRSCGLPACLRSAQSLLTSVLKAWRAEACLKARGAHVWLRGASPLVGLAMLDRLI